MVTPHFYGNQHYSTWLPTLFGQLGFERLLVASQNQIHAHRMTVRCPEPLKWDRASRQSRKRGFSHSRASLFIVPLEQANTPKCRDFWTICLKTKLGHTHSVLIYKLPIKCPEKRWELVRFIECQGPGGCGHSGCSVFRLHACSSAESDAWTGRGRVTA